MAGAIAVVMSAMVAAGAVPSALDFEEPLWAAVEGIGTAPAYRLFLDRYPQSAHHAAAVQGYYGALGRPVLQAPPPPPAEYLRLHPPAPPAPPPPGACQLFLGRQSARPSREAVLFEAARTTNQFADYRAYLADYPRGVCAGDASAILKRREQRIEALKSIPGLGPMRAMPRRAFGEIITADDYPSSAMRGQEEGAVTIVWTVAEDGEVETCHVIDSSGSPSLDHQACWLVTRRLRYDPARDAGGSTVKATDHLRFHWQLPHDPPPPSETGADAKPAAAGG